MNVLLMFIYSALIFNSKLDYSGYITIIHRYITVIHRRGSGLVFGIYRSANVLAYTKTAAIDYNFGAEMTKVTAVTLSCRQ